MHVLLHDFCGYPFVVPLARELARRGHRVTHAYCPSIASNPSGTLERRADDPPGLAFLPIPLDAPLDKASLATRWRQERLYGRRLAQVARTLGADVIVSADTPLDAQAPLQRVARASGTPFVFWLQDLIGEAMTRLLGARLGPVGRLIGHAYTAREARMLRRSDAVVAITDDFRAPLARAGVDAARVHVIENWGPLPDIPVRPQDNAWSRAHGLAGQTVLLYTGTLGMKHDPMQLVALAEASRYDPAVHIVVTSQGAGADVLGREAAARGLDRLRVLGFQPFEAMPDVMGAATVLVALLEPDAGAFSVPSKVLSYLCAARPLLLSIPPDNLAARIVAREGAGLVVSPGDAEGWNRAARTLLADAALQARMGAAGRAYAERTFAMGAIAERFDALIRDVAAAKQA